MKRGQMCLQIIRACYPKATDDDIDSCTPRQLIAMAAHAGHKIEQIRDALKNVGREEPKEVEVPATSPLPPSSPTTSGNTSASKSRRRSAGTSGTSSTVSPTANPT